MFLLVADEISLTTIDSPPADIWISMETEKPNINVNRREANNVFLILVDNILLTIRFLIYS
ncbi:MAG: hypothetical protein BAJATHORv1_10366 [Candidatus Thorarchaeota archaeon]|nr:MAG: hypothetical protein BAJATHORv1_10366 [Candidatus Thorarchaeota archaeon]